MDTSVRIMSDINNRGDINSSILFKLASLTALLQRMMPTGLRWYSDAGRQSLKGILDGHKKANVILNAMPENEAAKHQQQD